MRTAFCETAKAAQSEHFATLLKHCIEDDEKFAARLAAREKEAQEKEQREREEYERKQKDIQEFQRLKKEKLQEHGKKEVEEAEEDEVLDEEDNEEEDEDGEEGKKNRKKKVPALTISSADPDAIVDEEDRDSSGSGSGNSSSDDSNGEKSKKRLRIRSSIDELKKEKDGDEESIDLKERKIRSRKTSTKIGDEVEGDNPPPAEPGGSTSSRKPKVTRTRKRTIGGHEEHFSPALTPPGEQRNKDGRSSPRDSLVVAGHRYDETPSEASDTTLTTSTAPQEEPPAATIKEVLTIGIEEEGQGMEKVASGEEELSKPTDEPQQVQTAAPEDTQVHHVMVIEGGEEESQAARSGAELEGQEK